MKRILVAVVAIAGLMNQAIAQDGWTQKAMFSATGRFGAIGIGAGDKSYMGLGLTSTEVKNDFWEYDPSRNTWAQKADFPGGGGRSWPTGFEINGKVYVGTGYLGFSRNDFWEYDPATNEWTQKADFRGAPRYYATGFSIAGKAYIGGGAGNETTNSIKNDFWEYDPSTDVWTQKADIGGGPRFSAAGFSINGKGYIGTGIGYDGTLSDFWEYDPSSNHWAQKADFGGSVRFRTFSFGIGSKGYIGGGVTTYGTDYQNDLWEYDPVADLWTRKLNHPFMAREQASALSIGNKGYVGLGANRSVLFSDFWEYAPIATSNAIVRFDPIAVSTLAGDGQQGFVNGAANVARFNTPYDVAVDKSGNTYVADLFNHCIRKITPDGFVTTFAGSGHPGYFNGTGMNAQFKSPSGIATDANGNVFVADRENHRIRKISPAGVVTTLAGDGYPGFRDGDAMTAEFSSPTDVVVDSHGNVFLADHDNHSIRKISPLGVVSTLAGVAAGENDGVGLEARFTWPDKMAIDRENNIYVTQAYGSLRKITPAAVVTTIQPQGMEGFKTSVAVDSFMNIYATIVFSDERNNITKISPMGSFTPMAGGTSGYKDGSGMNARFYNPNGLTCDLAGNIYVAEGPNNRIRKLTVPTLMFQTNIGIASAPQTIAISGIHLTGPAILRSPSGFELSTQEGGPFVNQLSISPVAEEITTTTIFVRLSSGAAPGRYDVNIELSSIDAATQLLPVKGIVFASVVRFDPMVVSTKAGNGEKGFADGNSNEAKFNNPTAVASDTAGNIYVADYLNNRIRRISPDSTVTTVAGNGIPGLVNGMGSSAQFWNPSALVVDPSGNIYVADGYNNCIRKITPAGEVSIVAGGSDGGYADGIGIAAKFRFPSGITLDRDGNIYVADYLNHRIRKIDPSGVVTTFAGSGVPGVIDGSGISAQFYYPKNLSFDADGNLLVTEVYGPLRKITSNGNVSTIIAPGLTGFHDGVVADSLGDIYVSSTLSNDINTIYRVNRAGNADELTSTVYGYKDGSLSESQFAYPGGLCIDKTGAIYVADVANNRIRKISTPVLNFSTQAGVASASQYFNVSGTHLGGTAYLYAPDGYELSVSENSGYSTSTAIASNNGEITSARFYIRLKSSLGAGLYNGTISFSAPGAVTKLLSITGVVIDTVPPIIQCPTAQIFCFSNNNYYSVPVITATDISGIQKISYTITGATNRSGAGTNASGIFNPGTSTITWNVTDNAGNNGSCQTSIRIDLPLNVFVPDVYPLLVWGPPNTLYLGFGPDCARLTAVASGGTKLPSNTYKYNWSNGATTNSINVCPVVAGTYVFTVTITDLLGCEVTATKSIQVIDVRCGPRLNKVLVCVPGRRGNSEACVTEGQAALILFFGGKLGSCNTNREVITSINGIKAPEESLSNTSKMTVNPNPNNGVFTIHLNNFSSGEIRVLDQNGKVISSRKVNGLSKSQTLAININGVAKGMYLVQAIGKEGIVSCKMIVQ